MLVFYAVTLAATAFLPPDVRGANVMTQTVNTPISDRLINMVERTPYFRPLPSWLLQIFLCQPRDALRPAPAFRGR
jgi:hypothetical protein